MAVKKASSLAAAKAKVAKIEQAERKSKAVAAASAAVKKAQAQLKAAKGSPAKKKG
jgi:hypothetical protein